MKGVLATHLEARAEDDRAELDTLVKNWCEHMGNPHDSKSHAEFFKPSSFGAIGVWSKSIQRRLLQWQWHFAHATRDQPFVTSDRAVLMQWDRTHNVRLVTFPVSSEVALVINNGGRFCGDRDPLMNVRAMNRGTMDHATEFVVSCRQRFPCDEYLNILRQAAAGQS